jgi:hypothetical protein
MSNKKPTDKKDKITTLKLLTETKNRLEKLREHKRESYDDLLRKILFVLNTARDDPDRAKRILERIDELRKRMNDEESQQKEQIEKEKRRK